MSETFDDASPLVPYIRAVLAALDKAMPQWRIRTVRQQNEPIHRGDDRHLGRRKSKRWKW